jgi:hypothetical protein
MEQQQLVGSLTAVTAAGTAVTGLTEILKQYVPEDIVPPPLIAGVIAALFTGAWEVSQPIWPTWADTFSILMIWFSLFNMSIAVYHLAKISSKRRAGRRRKVSDMPAEHGESIEVQKVVAPGPR